MTLRTQVRNQNGSVLVEALVVAPVLIGGITLFLSSLVLAGSVSLLQDRLDETLICLTYKPRSLCESQMKLFIRKTGLSQLDIRTRFIRNGGVWSGEIFLQNPWGKDIALSRSLHSKLTRNIR